MEKIKLEYEETEEGYSLNIEGSTEKHEDKKDAVQIIEHQIKIISTIFFHLCEQKGKMIEKIKLDTKQKGDEQ